MTTDATKKKTTRAKKADAEETTTDATETSNTGAYLFAIGRRKTSVARVRLVKNGKGKITVNGRPMEEYFTTYELRSIVMGALKVSGQETALDVEASCDGGGIRGQAESVRLAISRALCELNPTFRKTLKKLGYLMRDPRAKERKKFGRKKARRSPQWSKR
jgi:small subunit ribosomal protein S9